MFRERNWDETEEHYEWAQMAWQEKEIEKLESAKISEDSTEFVEEEEGYIYPF